LSAFRVADFNPQGIEENNWVNWLIPYPVDYRSGRFVDDIRWDLAKNLKTLNTTVKEYVGILAYSLSRR